MPRRNLNATYRPLPQVTDPYYGEYADLARQLHGGNEPVYSVGQGIANVLGDVGKAYFEKRSLDKAKAKEEKDITDTSLAMQIAGDPSLRMPNATPGPEGQMFSDISPAQREQVAMQSLSGNPRAALAAQPGIHEMAQQFADKYDVTNNGTIIKTPSSMVGGAPTVLREPPKDPARHSVGNTLVDDNGNVIYRAPEKGDKAKTPVQLYQENIGTLEPGMTPEVKDGKLAGGVVPIPGGSKDPNTPTREDLTKAKTTQTKLADLDVALTDLKSNYTAKGTEYVGGNAGKMESQYRVVQVLAKELFDLGALQAPDLVIINGVLNDPTSFGANAASLGRGALDLIPGVELGDPIKEQFGVVEKMIKEKRKNFSDAYNTPVAGAKSEPEAGTTDDVAALVDKYAPRKK